MQTRLNPDDAHHLLQQLVGLPVSLPWKGYGTAIFLELGKLIPMPRTWQENGRGEANISISWDWRVESGATILYGSSHSWPSMVKEIQGLKGAAIAAISIQSQVPELAITFTNGQRLISAAMLAEGPAWTVRLQDQVWMSCESGVILLGDAASGGLTVEEEAAFRHADDTASRWGVPMTESPPGQCERCNRFVFIDAPGYLSDYGVCTSGLSPFDGRAVNIRSGCDAFTGDST